MKKEKTNDTGFSLKYFSVLLAILLAGTFLFWYSVHCGINQTYDSAAYIQATGSGSFMAASPERPWPPLFSMLLSILHFKNHLGYRIIQFIFMLTNFLLLLYIGQRTIPNTLMRMVWFMASFLGVSFLMVHVFLWSEPFFMVILFFMIIFSDQYLRKHRLPWLLLLILFSNLLCLQRNAGIFFVAGFAFSLAWFTTGKERILMPVILLVSGLISFMVWNLWLPGYRAGIDLLSEQSFFNGFFFNLGTYLNTISAWFLPRQLNVYIRIALLISGISILITGKPFSGIYRDPETVIFFIVIIYLTGISILGKIDAHESERYLAVIYPVALLPVVKRISSHWGRIKYSTRIFITILMLLWLSYITVRTVINAERWESASCSIKAAKQP